MQRRVILSHAVLAHTCMALLSKLELRTFGQVAVVAQGQDVIFNIDEAKEFYQ